MHVLPVARKLRHLVVKRVGDITRRRGHGGDCGCALKVGKGHGIHKNHAAVCQLHDKVCRVVACGESRRVSHDVESLSVFTDLQDRAFGCLKEGTRGIPGDARAVVIEIVAELADLLVEGDPAAHTDLRACGSVIYAVFVPCMQTFCAAGDLSQLVVKAVIQIFHRGGHRCDAKSGGGQEIGQLHGMQEGDGAVRELYNEVRRMVACGKSLGVSPNAESLCIGADCQHGTIRRFEESTRFVPRNARAVAVKIVTEFADLLVKCYPTFYTYASTCGRVGNVAVVKRMRVFNVTRDLRQLVLKGMRYVSRRCGHGGDARGCQEICQLDGMHANDRAVCKLYDVVYRVVACGETGCISRDTESLCISADRQHGVIRGLEEGTRPVPCDFGAVVVEIVTEFADLLVEGDPAAKTDLGTSGRIGDVAVVKGMSPLNIAGDLGHLVVEGMCEISRR